ncbi:MAG: hypothetical protein F9B45_30535 [Phycisphaera sp. RhM]|nr:hypothetical protein [Phycisphaera sp. RhM]
MILPSRSPKKSRRHANWIQNKNAACCRWSMITCPKSTSCSINCVKKNPANMTPPS